VDARHRAALREARRSSRHAGPLAGETAITGFRFTAWAKYRNWKRDAKIPGLVAKRLGKRIFIPEFGGSRVVLEGGSIDLNGRGTLLTTEECLLDATTQARNPGMSRADIESVMHEYLGASNVLWLGKGLRATTRMDTLTTSAGS